MKQSADFSVYKSSAGSGKTYTLVREYIVMALQSPSYFRHILAITFTNKAANEMKQRILLGLKHLAEPTAYADSPTVKFMLPDLVKITTLNKTEITSRASATLSLIIHEYDDFAVRTIDSFVSGIIRTFAHDLHLPVDFEIELDTDLLLEEATDNLIARVGEDKELTDVLIEYTRSKLDDEKSWRIDRDIAKTGKILFSEESFMYLKHIRLITPEITKSTARALKKMQLEFEQRIQQPAKTALELIDKTGIDHSSFFQGKNGLPSYLKKLSKGIVIDVPNYSRATIDEDKWFGGKISPDQRNAIEQIKLELKNLAEACFGMIDSGLKQYTLLGMIQRNLYQVGMLSALETEIDAIKKEKHVLHISEFNRRITDIILSEPVPFIYERTGEKYYNFLIDEFQDTSELQWKNLLPLIGNSLSAGHYNLIVGDGKQAIYRFRSGKVEQFVMLPALPVSFESELFTDTARAMLESYNEHILQSNFRSQPEIIRFNNEFFEYASNILSESHKTVYQHHQQLIPVGKSGGYVSVDFLPYTSKMDFQELNLHRVHELILEIKSKGFTLGDIAILTRTNKDGNELARYLLSNEIPVVSAEALLLAGSPEINLLVAILQYLVNNENQIATTTIIHTLLLKNPDAGELLHLINECSKHGLPYVLAKFQIILNRHFLMSLSLYDLCEELIRLFNLQSEAHNVYLQFFLDFVNKIASTKGTHLNDFLEAWELKKDSLSVVVPEGMNAVRILSIHKSKGLEFPIVIWPMATTRFKPTLGSLWVDLPEGLLPDFPVTLLNTNKNMLETGFEDKYNTEQNLSLLDQLNVAYVACTRPAEQLYIITRELTTAPANAIEIQQLLKGFIEKDLASWMETETGYERGKIDDTVNTATKTVDTFMFTSLISTQWQDRIKIARLSNATLLSDLTGDKRKWGNIIHETLSYIKTELDFESVILKQSQIYKLMIEEVKNLKSRVLGTIRHPKLSSLFSENWELKSESAVLTKQGQVFRPDRVLIKDKNAIILEFKTGMPSPAHSKQLLMYAELLQEMGYLVLDKFLVYIDEQIVVQEIE